MPLVRRYLLVSGQVQGVFYRDTCRRVAEAHDVAGWVRNLGDDQVEAVLEGSAPAVDEVIDWARQGPEQAAVTDVQIRDEAPQGLTGFAVR